MATASGMNAYCGINPQYAFALQRRGDFAPILSGREAYCSSLAVAVANPPAWL